MIKELIETTEAFTPEEPRPLMREIPPSSPYPVDALGTTLGSATKAIFHKVQAPEAICAQSVLAAGNLAAQGHVNVRLHTGQSRPISLELISILESGGRKSTCDELALGPIREKEDELANEYRYQLRNYKDDLDIYEKARQNILKPGKGNKQVDISAQRLELKGLGSEPLEPLYPIITLAEATPQGLFRTQTSGQPSIGIFTAEGGMVVGGAGMTADFKLEFACVLSQLWDGASIRKVRAGNGIVELKNRRFNMHLMLQPEVGSLFLQDAILEAQGLLSRVLVTAPASLMGTRQFNETGFEFDHQMAPFYCAVRHLLDKPYSLIEGTQNEIKPRVVELSAGAKACLITYFNHVESQLRPGGEMESIRGLANKLPEHAARLACTIAMLDDPEVQELSKENIEAGVTLADYYAEEAFRLKASSEADTNLLLGQRVLEWLLKWDEDLISLPDIYQHGPSKVRNQQEARRIVALLEDHGWLSEIEGSNVVNGKKRNTAWRIMRASK